MRCIFCLHERPGSVEHVFPFAIGGCLTTDRVCAQCNSDLGSRIDAALSDNYVVRTRRLLLGLAGNQGKAPPLYEGLLGVARLAEHPERKVLVSYNNATKKLEMKAIPYVLPFELPDGSKGCHLAIDERDTAKLPKIIQRLRRENGVPQLSAAALADEVKRFVTGRSMIENPHVVIERSYSFEFVRHAMIKIAYELAFRWLGEGYLCDPSAAELREAILSSDPRSTDKLPAAVTDAENFAAFCFWRDDKTSHLAYAHVGDDGIAIAIRVFDIHAAWVWVTKNAQMYLGGADPDTKLRFLAIDPESRKMRETQLTQEMLRIANTMVAANAARPMR